jgi:hypothetical protein
MKQVPLLERVLLGVKAEVIVVTRSMSFYFGPDTM